MLASLVNRLWKVSNLAAFCEFRRGLRQPERVQRENLRTLVEATVTTAFGRTFKFDKITSYEDFARRVPLSDYSALEAWVNRIQQGEQEVLTAERVTHLVPTSGSTGARKLIPFTAGLQRQFNAAIGAWLVDLTRLRPSVIGGESYWSITPVLGETTIETSAVPVGFDADTAYLGRFRGKLATLAMAVPVTTGRAKSLDEFRERTLTHLIRCGELRLISAWHPSFVTLLLDELPGMWSRLVSKVEEGFDGTRPDPKRAGELRESDPLRPETIWRHLQVISCWGEGAASVGMEDLRRRFPKALIQPKGLIATEGIVTIPFSGRYPLAIASHFYEFIDEQGQVFPVEELREGQDYEVIVTTAGGLWRYRLGDRVRVTGWLEKTPCLKLLGRGESVSDRFGEKLSEPFVFRALCELFGSEPPKFAMLAPDEDELGVRYTLYVEGTIRTGWPQRLEDLLRRNPHYTYCRDLKQLLAPRVYVITARAFETFAGRQAANGARLGDVKPLALSRTGGWSTVFPGRYC